MRTNVGRVVAACLLLALTAGVGCLGPRIGKGQPAYVYVTPNGVISFLGETVGLGDLADTMKRAGVKSDTAIRVISQGEVSDRLLKSIVVSLRRQGLYKAMIREQERRPSVLLDGKPVPLEQAAGNGETAPAVTPGNRAEDGEQ